MRSSIPGFAEVSPLAFTSQVYPLKRNCEARFCSAWLPIPIEILAPQWHRADMAERLVSNTSEPAAKIALFRSLFCGRQDVYPRRFESRKTGRAGYAPACANEWARGLCEKPRVKCGDCPNRRLLPVTDEVVRWHLSGKDDRGTDFVMGVYPMLPDETCHFLAVDFDGESWQAGRRGVSRNAAGGWDSRRRWNARAPAMAPTSGCFLPRRFRRGWRGISAPSS